MSFWRVPSSASTKGSLGPEICINSVAGKKTEVLDVFARDPKEAALRILVIPGNPGVSAYYSDYASALHSNLGGQAHVSILGYVAHTERAWERNSLFSLQDQIEHKIAFIEREIQRSSTPGKEQRLILVGHSIGAHIALQLQKQFPTHITHVLGLYPFLELNNRSRLQKTLGWAASATPLCVVAAGLAASASKLPLNLRRKLVRATVGKGWSEGAVDVTTSWMLKYHVVRNFAFMGSTEFQELAAGLDWDHLSRHGSSISFIFGKNDHWGPEHLCEEIQQRLPQLEAYVEEEGIAHAFGCTARGSEWVAAETCLVLRRQGLVE